MKFLNIILAATTFGTALSAPVLDSRQTTPASAISSSLQILQDTAASNEAAMTTAIANARNNVSAAFSVAASVSANLQAIANGFKDAAGKIADAFLEGGAGIGGQAKDLSDAELEALKAGLETLKGILLGLGAAVTFEVTNLVPEAQVLVESEVDFVLAAIAPVVNPVMVFADAASKARAKATATVYGIQNAYAGIQTIVQNLARTNGLPGVSFPGYVRSDV